METELELLRKQIDELDGALCMLLGQRFEITKQIGVYKVKNNLPSRDTSRETKKLKQFVSQAERANISPELAKRLLTEVMHEVVKQHDELKRAK